MFVGMILCQKRKPQQLLLEAFEFEGEKRQLKGYFTPFITILNESGSGTYQSLVTQQSYGSMVGSLYVCFEPFSTVPSTS